ncbi:MAG: NUDIX domain-containing protein [Deltaproteobacteria bacterium]|nr:NUDIX domain-containing protein [Deltaproteobacteria bacterium]
MPVLPPPKFCSQCGGPLQANLSGRHPDARWWCPSCDIPVYLDPKLAVAVVVEHQGKVLLLRRAQRDQAHGLWILPGGHVDRYEVVAQAALREVAEETGLAVELRELVGIYSYPDWPWVVVVYWAVSQGGVPVPDREALELGLFPPEALPWEELGYLSTREALEDWLASVSAGA